MVRGRMAGLSYLAAACLIIASSLAAEEGQPGQNADAPKQDVATPEPGVEQRRAKMDPKAKDVLKHVSEYFDGLDSYSVNAVLTMKMQFTGAKYEMESTYSVAFQEPNKLAVVTKGPMAMMSEKLISDGEKVYQHSPILEKTEVMPAPPRMGRSFIPTLMTTGPSGLMMYSFTMLDDELEEMTECVASMEYVGTEEVEGVKCHHMRASVDDMEWDVWIEAGERPLMRKFFQDMSEVFAKVPQDAPEEVKGLMDWETAKEMYKDAKYEISARFENWKVNPELPEDTFKFTPPPGADVKERTGPRVAANESSAVATLLTIQAAETFFRDAAEVDQDGDGIGEYGFLQELLGLTTMRGTERKASPAYLPPSLLPAGNMKKSGYYFKLYLPGDGGSALEFKGGQPPPMAGPEAIDMQERHFVCYAWPREEGRTGRRAFAATDDGEVYETRMEELVYDGTKSIPAARAVYEGDTFLSPRRGSDGNTWHPAYSQTPFP